MGSGQKLLLDLGTVRVLARVILNRKELVTLWKPPFVADISSAAKPGENLLEVKVVNLWLNRIIGDEQLPPDCEWKPSILAPGRRLTEWPKWFLEGKPGPTGRQTFATWNYWSKDSPLSESGLLGPVSLKVVAEAAVEEK